MSEMPVVQSQGKEPVANPSYFPSESDWKMMVHMGTAAYRSGLLPSAIKSPEAAAIIALKGRELGIPFMVAAAHVHIINGKPTLSAEMMQTLARKNLPGLVINILKSDETVAEVEFKRPEEGSSRFISKFTIEDARKANLMGKDVWRQYPAAMLYSRAVSAGLRKICPEALLGVSYTPEELGAKVSESGDFIETSGAEIRHPSPDQLKRLFAIAKSKGVSNEDLKSLIHGAYGIESTKELSLEQYDDVCNELETRPNPTPKPSGAAPVIKPVEPKSATIPETIPSQGELPMDDGPSFEQYLQHEGNLK